MKFLIVGLGNIGEEYWGTRHNIGFRVVNALAEAHEAKWEENRYGATCEFRVKNQQLLLLKPNTYMNLSGSAVRYWMQELSIPVENIIVICDDLNLPFGSLRMRGTGSDGGHNGLKNIIELIGTQDFARIRMGIGHDFQQGGQVDFVIGKINDDEKSVIPELCDRVIDGVQNWAFQGLQKAMTALNTKIKD